MSADPNPYAPSTFDDPVSGPTRVRPIQLLRRGYDLIRGEYWLYVGISFVAMIVSALVPFGILTGPMLVGLFLCFIQRQTIGRTQFETVFKGFDQFMDAFIATLIMIAFSIVVLIPVMLVFVAVIFMLASQAGPNAAPGEAMIATILIMYGIIFAASFAVYVPFIFTFQLIADRKVPAMVAVKASARAAFNNLGGVIWFIIANGLLMILAGLCCFLPAIFLLPLAFGAMWVFYQDVFGAPATAQLESS